MVAKLGYLYSMQEYFRLFNIYYSNTIPSIDTRYLLSFFYFMTRLDFFLPH